MQLIKTYSPIADIVDKFSAYYILNDAHVKMGRTSYVGSAENEQLSVNVILVKHAFMMAPLAQLARCGCPTDRAVQPVCHKVQAELRQAA